MKLKNISCALMRFSSNRNAFIALVVFLLFMTFVLPGQSSAAKAYSGDAGSPDLSLFYSEKDLYNMAEVYGSAGRDAYIQARFTFDLIFPLVYGGFLVTGISWLLCKITNESSNLRLLNLVPIAAMVFDLLENIFASLVIHRYPVPSPFFANLAPLFTLFKWLFVGGSFLILIVCVLILPFIKKK